MLLIAWLKSLFARQIAFSSSAENRQHSSLSKLPIELLLSITAYLDVSDAACLALTHQALAAKLGPLFWVSLQTTEAAYIQREIFLNRLTQDLPDFWCCQPCLRLHRKALVPPSVSLQISPLECLTRDHNVLLGSHTACGHQDMSRYALRFPHVHLAMKKHRNGGNYGIPIKSLEVTEVQTYSGNETEKKITTLFSVEPEITSDEMYLRVQHWALFPLFNPLRYEKLTFTHFCHHDFRCRSLLSNIVKAYEVARHESGILSNCRTLRCLTCSAEFEIEIRYFENGSTALVITKWLNLGPGESPRHNKWLRHMSFKELPEEDKGELKPESARRTFEQRSALSQELLTNKNEAILLTGQFYEFQQIPAYTSSYMNWIRSGDCLIKNYT
jgi:hypothetical protein